MTSNSAVWRPARKVVSREVDGQFVLVVLGRNEATFLNPVGSALWSRIDGRTSVETLVSELAAAYGMSQDEATEAVRTLLERLAALDLIEPAAAEVQPQEGTPKRLAFPPDYDVPAVAPLESLQVMGGCTSNDSFCSTIASV